MWRSDRRTWDFGETKYNVDSQLVATTMLLGKHISVLLCLVLATTVDFCAVFQGILDICSLVLASVLSQLYVLP